MDQQGTLDSYAKKSNYTIADEIWTSNNGSILSISVTPKSVYVNVTEHALDTYGIIIPSTLSVADVFVASADNSTGYTGLASSQITQVLNDEITRSKLDVFKKSIRIKVNLANYDCITGLLNKLKVAQIQFLTPTQ
jgi:hypothetical protein